MHDERFLQGEAAERRRLGAILLAPEAVGKEAAAIELALNSTLGAAEALAALAALPARNGQQLAMAATPTQGAGDGQ